MKLEDPIENLKGVGPAVASKLKQLKLFSVWDLINHLPSRYEDYSLILPIKRIRPGVVSIKAEVKQVKSRYVRRGMHITEAIASDETGSVRLVWFNQPYRAGAIKSGQKYFISGNFELSKGRLQIMNPSMELESDFPVNTARIVPVYKQTKGLRSHTIRKIIADLHPKVNQLPETLPSVIVESSKLLSRANAYQKIHFPESMDDVDQARKRIGFDELFVITLASLLNKKQFQTESGVNIKFDEVVAKDFALSLPYKLTNAQRRVVWQIYKDMSSRSGKISVLERVRSQHRSTEGNVSKYDEPSTTDNKVEMSKRLAESGALRSSKQAGMGNLAPMNRLVEGEVGSGKTVVAVMSAIMAMNAGYQVAIMAPTEILANQHAENVAKLLNNTPWADKVALLTSSIKSKAKTEVHKRIKSGEVQLVVGTHALITEKVDLKNLGLVIIDEQHRFGVEQRKKLQSKAKKMPHVLSLTATPIPRSLALTLYGELSVSILDEMPPGRTPITTKIVSPNSLEPMYDHIRSELKAGMQVFVVCPLIEESDALDVNSAEEVYKKLSTSVFKDFEVALLHGKQKSDLKDQIMKEFVGGSIDILVSTTVVEVGVDVPNATIMVIEGAERFGLAQAHQLRGRVGRGKHPGHCYLVMSDSKQPTKRLRALESTIDGFKLAELDLEIRGPGAIYGTLQSGQLDLRVANITDSRLVALVRAKAQQFIDEKYTISKYPELEREVNKSRTITNLN